MLRLQKVQYAKTIKYITHNKTTTGVDGKEHNYTTQWLGGFWATLRFSATYRHCRATSQPLPLRRGRLLISGADIDNLTGGWKTPVTTSISPQPLNCKIISVTYLSQMCISITIESVWAKYKYIPQEKNFYLFNNLPFTTIKTLQYVIGYTHTHIF